MSGWRLCTSAGLLIAALAAAACGSEAPPPAAAPAGSTAAPAAGRVFFIEPQNAGTVKSPVRLRFGIEKLEILPVPTCSSTTFSPCFEICGHGSGSEV